MPLRDDRSAAAQAYRHLYKDKRWRGPHGVRTLQLRDHPLCAMCERQGRVTAATVCDHVDPKDKECEAAFFAGPFQSLCKEHHDSSKQREERRGHIIGSDESGWPLDPHHPWNA